MSLKLFTIYSRESNGKYTFAAHMDGEYRYCFSNKMSSMTTKIVMFNMELSESPAEAEAGVFMFLFLIKQNMTKYF